MNLLAYGSSFRFCVPSMTPNFTNVLNELTEELNQSLCFGYVPEWQAWAGVAVGLQIIIVVYIVTCEVILNITCV